MTIDREERWSAAMRAANRGDAAAYESLLGDIAVVLRRLVRRRLARLGFAVDETDDIVQETLLAIHEKRATWDESRPILPWVHAIARYKLVDATRQLAQTRRRLSATPVEEWGDRLAAPAAAFDRLAGDLVSHLGTLTERQRAVVLTIVRDGATVKSAARRLSMTEGAVRTAWHRSLVRLRALADEDPSPCTS